MDASRAIDLVGAAVATDGTLDYQRTHNCGYQDGPALFVVNRTDRTQQAVIEYWEDMFAVVTRSGELYATTYLVSEAVEFAKEATAVD